MMAISTKNREFRFVPYGSTFDANADAADGGRPTISCDGRIPGGVTLELTHWTDNKTPDSLYADTSTEMALKFAKLQDESFDNALILNNHYDSDGVLSVWACLKPTRALEYATLLKEGAEAGDFGEWSSDNGVKLDCAIESFLASNEEEAYENVLKELPGLLQDLEATGGESYQDLWNDSFQQARRDWEALQNGNASLERGPGKMVVVKESGHHISPYALHRGLVDAGLAQGTTRILRCLRENDSKHRYRYELPGHGWVKKLVDRPIIPAMDGSILIKELSEGWAPSGRLVGICHTTRAIESPPEEVASLLHQLDDGCK